jgi:hypothetical protein
VPESATVCMPAPALSRKTRDAVAVPVAEGLKVNTTTQLAPGDSVEPAVQVVDAATMLNADALVPVMFGLAVPLLGKVSIAVPEFVSVTITWIPVPPTGTEPNCTVPDGTVTEAECGI